MDYLMPTRVIMGEGCVRANSACFSRLGKRALVVTGRSSARTTGALSDVLAACEQEGIEAFLYEEVTSNPDVACCYAGAALARSMQVDFIVAVGGGSPMDAAKAIALLACQDVPEDYFFTWSYTEKALPLIAVPTTAGTGSEVTPYAIITDRREERKTSIASPAVFPKIAFLDAAYIAFMPRELTIHTAIDALSHAVEGMLTSKTSPLSDALALEAIARVGPQLKRLAADEKPDREALLYGSMVAGMVIAQAGTALVHAMGYPLTYHRNIDHGRANGLILGAWFRLMADVEPGIVAAILRAAGLPDITAFETLLNGLLGEREPLTADEITRYSELPLKLAKIKKYRVMPTAEEIAALYRESCPEK